MIAVIAVGIAASREASAFCRTTTCDVSTEQCTLDVHGCVRSGAPLSWRALPIPYRFHAAGSSKLDNRRAREAVRVAFTRWTDAICGAEGQRTSLRFDEQEDLPADLAAAPARADSSPHFGVFFRDEGFVSKNADSALALTTMRYGELYAGTDHAGPGYGYVTVADMEINTTTASFATSDAQPGIDLQAVITHEVGHYIGLAHSKEPLSIMAETYCASKERCGAGKTDARELAADDLAAVCALYPPGGRAGVQYEAPAAGSCATAPPRNGDANDGTPAQLGAAIAVAAVLAARARARRRGASLQSRRGQRIGASGSGSPTTLRVGEPRSARSHSATGAIPRPKLT